MKIQVVVFWVLTPCNVALGQRHSEDLDTSIFTLKMATAQVKLSLCF